jgi:hypothetical protein
MRAYGCATRVQQFRDLIGSFRTSRVPIPRIVDRVHERSSAARHIQSDEGARLLLSRPESFDDQKTFVGCFRQVHLSAQPVPSTGAAQRKHGHGQANVEKYV